MQQFAANKFDGRIKAIAERDIQTCSLNVTRKNKIYLNITKKLK